MPAYEPQNWEDKPSTQTPITAARLRHIEEGITAAIRTVNGRTGPDATVSLGTLPDVVVPTRQVDPDSGEVIEEGPVAGDVLVYNPDTGLYESGPAPASGHNHGDTYAPLGYEPPFMLKGVILEPGESPPENLPDNAVVFDKGSLNGIGGLGPADAGLKGWAYDPAIGSNSSTLDVGTLRLSWIPVRAQVAITQVATVLTNPGVGVTTSGLALYDGSTGARLATITSLTDDTGAATDFNSAGPKFGVLSATIIREFGQHVYVGQFCVGGTTAPSLLRGTGNDQAANIRYPRDSFPLRYGSTTMTGSTAPTSVTLASLSRASGAWAGYL